MNQFTRILWFVVYCGVLLTVPWMNVYGQVDWEPSLYNPAALLIQDEAVRFELTVAEEQIRALDRLCERLDPLLFAMRDMPADTTYPQAIALAAQITEKLKELDNILNSRQQQRLEQLRLQYEGFGVLFYTRVQSHLRLTAGQTEQIRKIHSQSLARQQEAMQRKSADQDASSVQRKIQKIQHQETQQILHVMSNDQRKRWQTMLGEGFNFSRMRPFSFRAPELRNVTAWINTKPISMEDLRGRVVVVHFWTFGCSNCIQNYPVYKQWTKQFDPKEVFVLGIHTPEAEYEKDQTVLRERIEQEGLSFAVAVDNDKTNWKAWSNRMWPSVYLVDKTGRVRYWWYGELRWQGATGDQLMTKRIEELKAER